MTKNTIQLTEALYDYLLSSSLREPEVLKQLREETENITLSVMQISPDQGQFMQLLVKLLSARNCLEVGVYTGYSSLCVALAMPEDGKLVACDIDEDWTAVARKYWDRAGVAHKIDLHLAPATQTLQQLLDAGKHNRFDFAFIDADKSSYADYYEYCLKLVRPGGLIVVDNTLWGGSVADNTITDPDTSAIRSFNKSLLHDERVDISMLAIADGLTLIHKRAHAA
ncbi:MAG TPA: SAM-dependent methyltransferase [Gammaproteobacteria bacterium]|nr:SAM-dependent methyltransferase [Gammaproteobacteria bacterium]